MLGAALTAIEYHLPDAILTSEMLAAEFPEWSVQKIEEKTGISERHIAAEGECASDLGMVAAQNLFESGRCAPSDIDYILLCTQSPDYFLPTTACILQDRLGIPKSAGALDFNLGCSGFVYGVGLAKGLIETHQAAKVLLITAETYSKFIHAKDRSVRTIFGDAGAATLIEKADNSEEHLIGPFVYGTDGRGKGNLIVPAGGMRTPSSQESAIAVEDCNGSYRSRNNLFMDGAEIFSFTLREIPDCVNKLLERSGCTMDDVDLFIFHQANRYMLEHLRKKLRIPSQKFYIGMQHCGNTVSSSIPIAIKQAVCESLIKGNARVAIAGFGVGYSWAAAMIRIATGLVSRVGPTATS